MSALSRTLRVFTILAVCLLGAPALARAEPQQPVTAPGAVDPGAVDPGAVDPGAVNPGAVDPGAVNPGAVDPGWLVALNHLRDQGGLPPVTEVDDLSQDALSHARFAVANDTMGHREDPALPGYTPEGDAAAAASNLVYYSTPLAPVAAIQHWVGSIAHLAWMVNPRLQDTGFGLYHKPDDAGFQSVGVLDVISGLGPGRVGEYLGGRSFSTWPSDGAHVLYGVHRSCPAGIGSLVVTLADADLPLIVTAVDGIGIPRDVARHDQVAESGVGFTTCGVADGDTLTWTVQVGIEITQVTASYGNADSIDQWPTDSPVTTEFWVPGVEPQTAAGAESGSGAVSQGDPAPPVSGSSASEGQTVEGVGVHRRTGATPSDLAITLAAEVFAARGDADFAILSRDDDFADSLAGTALARFGPILFTATTALSPSVAGWLSEGLEDGDTVYLLGGEAALSPAVEAAVEGLGLRPVRLAGTGRVQTALRIADEAIALVGQHYANARPQQFGSVDSNWEARRFNVARADNWADAIAVAPFAAGLSARGDGCCEAPVTLLSPRDRVDPELASYVRNSAMDRGTILGGTAAISDDVASGLGAGQMDRQAGEDRAATAAAIGVNMLGLGSPGDQTGILLIDGDRADGWAWGLAATSWAFHHDMAILMVRGDAIPSSTQALLQTCVPVEILGNTDVISAEVASAVANRTC